MVTMLKDGGEIRIYSFVPPLLAQKANTCRHAAPPHTAPEPRAVRTHDNNRALPRVSTRGLAVFVCANVARPRLHATL